MKISLYYNNSDDRKLNKNLQFKKQIKDVKLKEKWSIINPVLILSRKNFNDFNKMNYVYIEDFRRYYFIQNMEFINSNVILDLQIDVLTTYASPIKSLSCLVKRQEKVSNMDLTDERFKLNCQHDISYKYFANTPFSITNMESGKNCIALTVTGGRIDG